MNFTYFSLHGSGSGLTTAFQAMKREKLIYYFLLKNGIDID